LPVVLRNDCSTALGGDAGGGVGADAFADRSERLPHVAAQLPVRPVAGLQDAARTEHATGHDLELVRRHV